VAARLIVGKTHACIITDLVSEQRGPAPTTQETLQSQKDMKDRAITGSLFHPTAGICMRPAVAIMDNCWSFDDGIDPSGKYFSQHVVGDGIFQVLLALPNL
jgi:hypothetical protein